MRTAILQGSFVTNSLLHVWFHTVFAYSSASYHQQHQQQHQHPHQQCRQKEPPELWDHRLLNLTYLHTPLPDTSIFQHNERDDCPPFHNFFHKDHLSAQQLSLCPWSYVRTYDPDRYPSEMFYARCSCKRCVSWDNSGLRHECKAHYHAFNVIRRVCENGRYRFHQAHEYLPIACVCSHGNMRIVGSNG